MYKGYPISLVVIYYEAPTVEISIKQIKKIRDFLHEVNNYFVNRHASIYIIANVPGDCVLKEMHTISSKDNCISEIFCSSGFAAEEIIDLVIGIQLENVDQNRKLYDANIKLLPIQVIAIQYKNMSKRVIPQMFNAYQKYLRISNFTVSYETNDVKNNEGGFEVLRNFLNMIFVNTISKSIADAIEKLESEEIIEPQSFFFLE